MSRLDREERDDQARRAVLGAHPNQKGWARANCPFCLARVGKDDRKACFGLNVKFGRFHCFRCGIGGRLSGFEESVDFSVEAESNDIEPPDGFEELEGALRTALCAKPFFDYLRGRRVSSELSRELGIGACLAGRYANRVIVPVKNDDGDWLWWVGRSIWKTDPRGTYRYPSGSRQDVLFNHRALFVETDEPAYIVEGAFDAIALWPNGLAVLGKPTENQIAAFAAARRPVVVVLDGDAWEEGWALGLRLKYEGGRAGSIRLDPRVDPDEVDVDALRDAAIRSLETIDPVRIEAGSSKTVGP